MDGRDLRHITRIQLKLSNDCRWQDLLGLRVAQWFWLGFKTENCKLSLQNDPGQQRPSNWRSWNINLKRTWPCDVPFFQSGMKFPCLQEAVVGWGWGHFKSNVIDIGSNPVCSLVQFYPSNKLCYQLHAWKNMQERMRWVKCHSGGLWKKSVNHGGACTWDTSM